MVEQANVTDEEFERLKRSSRSRWADVIRRLQAGEQIIKVSIPKDEDNAQGRRRLHQQIYSAAYQAGIRTSILRDGSAFLVKHAGQVKP